MLVCDVRVLKHSSFGLIQNANNKLRTISKFYVKISLVHIFALCKSNVTSVNFINSTSGPVLQRSTLIKSINFECEV